MAEAPEVAGLRLLNLPDRGQVVIGSTELANEWTPGDLGVEQGSSRHELQSFRRTESFLRVLRWRSTWSPGNNADLVRNVSCAVPWPRWTLCRLGFLGHVV